MTCRWAFNINQWKPSYEELAQISGIIQREEKNRISKFYFIKDAKASIVGRLMMRKLISQRLGIQNTDIVLRRDEHNKPILMCPTGFTLSVSVSDDESVKSPNSTDSTKSSGDNDTSSSTLHETSSSSSSGRWSPANPQLEVLCKDLTEITRRKALLKNLNFNVSHQGSYAVLASDSAADRIGIDIMNITSPGRIVDRLDDYFRMMNRQFTDHEWVQIRTYYGREDSKQLVNFTRFWCLKESYVKAIGVGIIIDLRRVEFHTDCDLSKIGKPVTSTKVKIDGEWRLEWEFEERFIDGQHIVTVAKEFTKRMNGEEETEDLTVVEKETQGEHNEDNDKTDEDSTVSPGGDSLDKSAEDDSNEFTSCGLVKSDTSEVPQFEIVQLDFILGNMNLLEKPDYEWIEGVLGKK